MQKAMNFNTTISKEALKVFNEFYNRKFHFNSRNFIIYGVHDELIGVLPDKIYEKIAIPGDYINGNFATFCENKKFQNVETFWARFWNGFYGCNVFGENVDLTKKITAKQMKKFLTLAEEYVKESEIKDQLDELNQEFFE